MNPKRTVFDPTQRYQRAVNVSRRSDSLIEFRLFRNRLSHEKQQLPQSLEFDHKTLSRSNTHRHSHLSKRGREAASLHAKTPKTPEPVACETNLSAISDLSSDPREEDWPTDDSFIMEPDFSDPMSDNASEEYQTKQVNRTADDIGDQPTKQEVRRTRPNGCKN